LTEVREWLPANAAENDRVREALDEIVVRWARSWFSHAVLGVTGLASFAHSAPQVDADAGWRIGTSGFAVSASSRARARLSEWALNVRLSEHSLSNVDQQLLERFEDKMLEDLLSQLYSALGSTLLDRGSDLSSGGLGGVIAKVSELGGGGLLTIAAPLAAVLALCCAPSGERSRGGRLVKLADSVAPLPMTLEALLGEAEVSLAELQGLAAGDVLVLGAALSDPGSIRLVNAGATVARAKLTEIDGAFALVLQPR
jgi:hypothetical protein